MISRINGRVIPIGGKIHIAEKMVNWWLREILNLCPISLHETIFGSIMWGRDLIVKIKKAINILRFFQRSWQKTIFSHGQMLAMLCWIALLALELRAKWRKKMDGSILALMPAKNIALWLEKLLRSINVWYIYMSGQNIETFEQADKFLKESSEEEREKWDAYTAMHTPQVSAKPSSVSPAVSLTNDLIVPVGSECSEYLPDGQSCNKKYAGKNCRKYFFKGEDGEFYRCRFHKSDDGQCGEIGQGGWFSKKKKCHEDEKNKSRRAEKRKKLGRIMKREKYKQAAEEKERKKKETDRKNLEDACDFFGGFSDRNIFSGSIPYMESAEAYRQCLKEEEFDKHSYIQHSMGGREEERVDDRMEGGKVNSHGLPLNFNKFKEYFKQYREGEDWDAFKIKAKEYIAEENKKESFSESIADGATRMSSKRRAKKEAARKAAGADGGIVHLGDKMQAHVGGAKKIQKKTKKKKYKSKTNKKKLRKSVRKGGRKSVRKGGRKRVRKGGRKSVRKGGRKSVRVGGRKKSKRRQRN